MAKNAIREYSTTAANNTDIGGIGVTGNNLVSNFDDGFRTIMKQLADMNAGTSSIDDTFTLGDPADTTKKVRFDAGAVTAGQTRVLAMPDANVTISAFAATVLDDADAATMVATLNAVPKNADSGVTLSSTSASIAIPPGSFGGLFVTDAFTSNRVKFEKIASDATAGPRFAGSYSAEVLGGHANGPDNQRGALYVLGYKKNWDQVGALSGEVDGITVQIAQGNLDDAGGILIDATKIFDAGGTGGLTPIELAGTRKNLAGTILSKVRAILGLQEGAGGALNGAGASFYAECETGTSNIGAAIVNHTANFAHAVAGFLSRSSTARWFSIRWDGDPVFELGSTTDAMKVRFNASAMKIQDETGALNHYVMAKDGIFRARAGMIVADNQATLKRVLTNTASLNVASTAAWTSSAQLTMTVTGAQVGDTVYVNIVNGTLAGAQFNYLAEVTASDTVTIYPFNMSGAVADPAVQTFRATVFGF